MRLKDPISGATHFLAALLAIVGTILLLVRAGAAHKPWHLVTFSIFGGGMILLYAASTLYHWIPARPRIEARLQRLDHMMIFVLIAASYTPVCLIPLRGGWGWSLFGVVWTIALTGILMKVLWMNAPTWVSTLIYVAMGWLAIVGTKPLIESVPITALVWLLIGGLFYSAGAVVYVIKKPNPWPKWVESHEVFHVLTMLGTGSHFWFMYHYILPMNV